MQSYYCKSLKSTWASVKAIILFGYRQRIAIHSTVSMSLDSATDAPVQRVGDAVAETAIASETSTLLDAVRAVVQQEIRSALERPAGPEGTPATLSSDPAPSSRPVTAAATATASASSSGLPAGEGILL